MKKIMFNDKYGLTGAVLDGRKTMTRRIIPDKIIEASYRDVAWETAHLEPTSEQIDLLTDKAVIARSCYKVGDIVAVAQSYESIRKEMLDGHHNYLDDVYEPFHCGKFIGGQGYHNKMFVRADLMPHRIRITDVRIERMQDITEEDCLREGITREWLVPGRWFYHLPNVPVRSKNDVYLSHSEAFSVLINKLSRRDVWEINPYVFVYSFELVK